MSGLRESLLLSFGVFDGQLNPLGLMAVGSHLENAIAAAAHLAGISILVGKILDGRR